MYGYFFRILACSFLCLAVLFSIGGCRELTLSELVRECWKVDEVRIGANSFDLIIKASLCEMNIYLEYADLLDLPEKKKMQFQMISRKLNDIVLRKSAEIEAASFDLVDEMGAGEIDIDAVRNTISELRVLCNDLAFQLCYNTAKTRRIMTTTGVLQSVKVMSGGDSKRKIIRRMPLAPCDY